MGRVLRAAGPGLLGIGVALGVAGAWWFYDDVTRNRLDRPTPIHVVR